LKLIHGMDIQGKDLDICTVAAADDFKLLNTDELDSPSRNYLSQSQTQEESDDDDNSDCEDDDELGPMKGAKTEKARWTDTEVSSTQGH
jgi:hypothetical protein